MSRPTFRNPLPTPLAMAVAKLPDEALRVQMAAALAPYYAPPAYVCDTDTDMRVASVRRAFDLAYRDGMVPPPSADNDEQRMVAMRKEK